MRISSGLIRKSALLASLSQLAIPLMYEDLRNAASADIDVLYTSTSL